MNKAVKWITESRRLSAEHQKPLDELARAETKAAQGLQALLRKKAAGTLPQSTILMLSEVRLCPTS